MWIERIRFYGFGPIVSTIIDLGDQQINVLAEKNEQLKELLLCCIWSTLFGFPRDSDALEIPDYQSQYKPADPKELYRVSIDLTLEERKLRITRDFAKRAMQVMDRDKKENVTSSFRGPDGSDKIGPLVTGMSSELFRKLCMESSSSGMEAALECLASSVTAASTPGNSGIAPSLSALDNALQSYELDGNTLSLSAAIEQLRERRAEVSRTLSSMDQERENARAGLKELKRIDQLLDRNAGSGMAAEINNLRMQMLELSNRMEFASGRLDEKQKIDEQVRQLELKVPSHSNVVTRTKNLWTRRESRRDDARKMADEIVPREKEYSSLNEDLHSRYDTVNQFTLDEANAISGLAINLYKLQQELDDLQKDLQEQTGRHMIRVQASSDRRAPALEALGQLRKTELEQVQIYGALLVLFRARMAEEKKKISNAKLAEEDIDSRRNERKKKNLVRALIALAVAVVLAGVVIAFKFLKVPMVVVGICLGVAAIAFVFFLLFAYNWVGFRRFMQAEAIESRKEVYRHEIAWGQAQEKIGKLNTKLSAVAVKTGVEDLEEFLKYATDVSSHESMIQEHEDREQSVETEEQRYAKIKKDLSYYFEKANLDATVIDSQRAMDLSQQITNFHNDSAEHEKQFEELRNAKSQLEFLQQEIADIDNEIKSQLKIVGLEVGDDEAELEKHATELLQADEEKQRLLEELGRIEYDLAGFGNVSVAITQMEHEKHDIEQRIEELLDLDPDLADLDMPTSIEDSGSQLLPWGNDASQSGDDEELRESRQQVLSSLQESVSVFDGPYLDLTEQLDEIEHELERLVRAQRAISMAKDGILAVSSVGGSPSPTMQLNEQARALLSSLSSNLQSLSFGSDLTISAVYDNQEVSDLKASWSDVPEPVRDQIGLVIAILASRSTAVPLFISEPSPSTDADTLQSMTALLLSTSALKKQVILPCCHYKRYQDLRAQLDQSARAKLTLRARKKIAQGKETSRKA